MVEQSPKILASEEKNTTTSLTHVVYHGAAIPRLSMTACVTIVNPDLCISGRVNAPKNTTS